MSSMYIQEPPTHGKVVLKTSFGELDIELWSREAPKACRNFVQLCVDGFYNGIIFHRVIKKFIAQTGDPTGTGDTSISIYGAPYKNEIHSRLRFNRRGLVACANSEKDDNGSQFFITLDATPELQGIHTIFGKVVGDTLYNLIKLNDILIEDERPVYEEKIIKTDVLNNPFKDITPRVSVSSPAKNEPSKVEKLQEPGVKNLKLLSFGDEAEDEEDEPHNFIGKMKSSHDVLNDPRLSSKTILDSDDLVMDDEKLKLDQKMQLEIIKNKLSNTNTSNSKEKIKKVEKPKAESEDDLGDDDYFENKREEEKKRKLKEIRREVNAFKRDLRKEKLEKLSQDVKVQEKEQEKEIKNELLKEYKVQVEEYSQKQQGLKVKGSAREKNTLLQLQSFTESLGTNKSLVHAVKNKPNKYATLASLVESDSDEDLNSKDWLACSLNSNVEQNVLAKDANTKSDDWYDIYHPRNPINKRRRETGHEDETKKKHKLSKNDL